MAAILALCSCTAVDYPSSGIKLGEIYFTSKAGSRSILVKTSDKWRVETDCDWISLDVNGGVGEAAFTITCGSNESDFANPRLSREACVVIRRLSAGTSDTLYVVQQGFPDGIERASTVQDSYIEFVDVPLRRIKVVYANFGSATVEDVEKWIAASDADLIAGIWSEEGVARLKVEGLETGFGLMMLDKSGRGFGRIQKTDLPPALAVSMDGKMFQIADFPRDEPALEMMRNLMNGGYDRPESESDWIVGGSFYYLSAMEMSCPDTPDWYPDSISDPRFKADIYAQYNNLTDCLWMVTHHFNPTWTEDGKSWRADYVYASNSAWNSVVDVKLGPEPVSGASHKTIAITLKY